ncbi:MAG: hypothetical protein LRY54_03630 [Alphaproteobacteria bacterium]|nr:hypothetical protein [Alphaproteobacteria bacterium]
MAASSGGASLSAPPAYTAALREEVAPSYPSGGGGAVMASIGRGGEALALLTEAEPAPLLQTLDEVVGLLEDAGEVLLGGRIYQYVRLVKLEDTAEAGHLEFVPAEGAPPTLAQAIREGLITATKRRWMVSIAKGTGASTLAEQTQARLAAELEAVKDHPLTKAVFNLFPGAEITDIKKT